jgi:serine/threonine protein kinase
MREMDNKVKTSDFDYFEALDQGHFGVVFKVRKKTTRKLYAMKILSKHDLLQDAQDGGDLDLEVKVLAAMRHPFIIHMDYSFQNDQFAFIVMELAVGVTLQSIPDLLKCEVLTESQVRFYVAEIVEALHYLHGIDLIYRDLQPVNVLIDMAGHVKLADLCGMPDVSGNSGKQRMVNFGKLGSVMPVYKARHLDEPSKRRCYLGTRGFMSPQMVDLLSSNRQWAEGYSYMTDYWSLGVLVYDMLTGKLPFNVPGGSDKYSADKELQIMKQNQIEFPESVSAECVQFISSLLKVDETRRLGYGVNGLADIQKHPFFASSAFDWSQVLRKHCKPPIVPSGVSTPDAPMYRDFEDLPVCMAPKYLLPQVKKDQELFKNWYVMCMQCNDSIIF